MESITLSEIELKDSEATTIAPNLGIGEKGLSNINSGLKEILANSYMLMLKTQNYHWNVRGKMFISVHELTEKFYNDLFQAVDDIAERIRSLGDLAPGSLKEFQELGSLSDNDSNFGELEMVQDLVAANELLAKQCRTVVSTASDHKDEATADLLTVRLGVHEKCAWMFRSFLEA